MKIKTKKVNFLSLSYFVSSGEEESEEQLSLEGKSEDEEYCSPEYIKIQKC